MKPRKLVLIVLLLFSAFVHAQLSDFIIQVTPTNETCSGNGSAAISLQNTTPNATMQFSLYLLPDVATPLNQFNQNSVGGLNSGNYRIVAVQTLGAESNSETIDFVILDQSTPLVFQVVESASSICNQIGGILTVNVTSGVGPFFYEITAGQEIRPLQTSNQFTGLQSGAYLVRVVDACGADVFEYTLQLSTNNLTIGLGTTAPVALSCTDAEVLNSVTPNEGANIIYPINVTYTIHPPSGVDEIIVLNYPSGPPDLLELSLNLPLFPNDVYTYDILIVDSCGTPFSSLNNIVDPNPTVTLTGIPNVCGDEFLTLTARNFSPPFTINFTNAPAGFSPSSFNTDPGPYDENDNILNFGNDQNTVPIGIYEVTISDSCGRTSSSVIYEVEDVTLDPSVVGSRAACATGLGSVRISIPENRKVVSAIIVSAPPQYTPTLPNDVSSFINANTGVLFISGLPVGEYLFTITDSCGDVYSVTDIDPAVILPFSSQTQNLSATVRPSCSSDMGSVRVRTNSGGLVQVFIIDAPDTFTETLPFDVSAHIVNGILYMNELPAGYYVFEGTDICNITQTATANIVGYISGVNNYTFERNCGSFNLSLNDQSNTINNSTYWFQKLNTATNTWEHPATGVAYAETTIPNLNNSIPLTNNTTVFNLSYIGTFRIVKIYPTFDGGNTNCIQIYDSFNFSGDLQILNEFTIDCDGGPSNIYIEVEGVPPFLFRIIKKNGQDFLQENGSNNTFIDLEPGLYEFEVEDSCTRLDRETINIGTLMPLVTASNPVPAELLNCSTDGTSTSTFDLTSLTASILDNQPPQNYTVTYHLTSEAANDGSSPIATPENFTNTVNPQPIFVRVVHKTITVCYATTSFTVYVAATPVLTMNPTIVDCDGGNVRIFADPGFDGYEWSTGETTASILVNQPGVYSVNVKNIYGQSSCDTSKDITVIYSSIASNLEIETSDWTDNQNTITVNVRNGSGKYVYSLDGINYQEDNIFTNLVPGVYTIFIDDTQGCGFIEKEVVLLNYPKYFTPNGDGFNETWQIKFAALEPQMTVYIFDRYGKLITGFDAKSRGWDGTLNGKLVPSEDYWFMVERADGRILRGHFTLKL